MQKNALVINQFSCQLTIMLKHEGKNVINKQTGHNLETQNESHKGSDKYHNWEILENRLQKLKVPQQMTDFQGKCKMKCLGV